MKNNVHDKVFKCPKCQNRTLYPIDSHPVLGVGHGDHCVCDECAAELEARVNYDLTVQFVEPSEEEITW